MYMYRFERVLFRFATVVGIIALVYLSDWAVLRVRIAHGTGYRTVQITQLLATPLKGNKAEYDMMGTSQETCSRSIFPQKGDLPCWWLLKHTSQWE
jgi:hypothetical protein